MCGVHLGAVLPTRCQLCTVSRVSYRGTVGRRRRFGIQWWCGVSILYSFGCQVFVSLLAVGGIQGKNKTGTIPVLGSYASCQVTMFCFLQNALLFACLRKRKRLTLCLVSFFLSLLVFFSFKKHWFYVGVSATDSTTATTTTSRSSRRSATTERASRRRTSSSQHNGECLLLDKQQKRLLLLTRRCGR